MYSVTYDYGRPCAEQVESREELKALLTRLHIMSKEEHPYFDVHVYNEDNEEITDSQFIEEMVAQIREED
jgi:hypothetical protein